MELSIDQTLKLIGIAVTVGLAIVGYIMANRNWQRQIRYDNKIVAYKSVWSLFAYMAHEDNPKRMFEIYEEGSNKEIKNMYLYEDRVEPFFDALECVIYEEGHGIYLPSEFRTKLFTYRRQVGSIFYSSEKTYGENGLILIQPKFATKLRSRRQEMIEELRQLMKKDKMV